MSCFGTAPQVDQLRALSLNRLDGMLRSTSVVADLPFKCTSDPRLGDRQLSSSTALDQLSMSPRLNSDANLSQDLDFSDLLPVAGSVTDVSLRTPGVALTRSVSVRTAVSRPATNHHLLAPTAQPGDKSSSRRHTQLTSEQRLPFPECPAVSGGVLRRSASCPQMMDVVDLAVGGRGGGGERSERSEVAHLLPTEPGGGHCRRRRSSAFERDVDLRDEVVADLPVALRAQFPDFDPEAPLGAAAASTPTLTVTDRRPPASVVAAAPTVTVAGHRHAVSDCRLLMPNSTTTARHTTMMAGCFTPPTSRCDIQIKCLRWLRDTDRHEQQ